MTVNEAFLNCISAFLKGERVSLEFSEAQWQELIKKAHEQKMLPMVFEAAGQGMPSELYSAVKSRVKLLVSGQVRRTEEFKKLYSELTGAGIEPIVVKGIVCRSVYSKPDYRASADEDLYICKDYASFKNAMLKLGFSSDDTDNSNSNEECFCRRELVIEGHWNLFPNSLAKLKNLNELSEQFCSRTVKMNIDGVELLTLEPTDHLAFLLLHAYKHFIYSGVGIRQMCDIALWAENSDIDWQKLHNIIFAVNAECFAAAIFDAAEKYLGLPFPPMFERADCTALVEDALDAGIYGSSKLSRRHSALITLNAIDAADGDKVSMPVIKSLFPSKESLQTDYPWLKKNGALLPAAWGIRIIKYAFKDKSSAAESVKLGNERIKLLKQYKIL